MWNCCQASAIIPYEDFDGGARGEGSDVKRVNIKTKPSAKYLDSGLQSSGLGNTDNKSRYGPHTYLSGSKEVPLRSGSTSEAEWANELENFYKCVEVGLQGRVVPCDVGNEMDKLIHCSIESDKNHVFVQFHSAPSMNLRLQKLIFKDPTKTAEVHLAQYSQVLSVLTLMAERKKDFQVLSSMP